MRLKASKVAIAAAAALSMEASAQFIELDITPTLFAVGVATVPDYRGSDDNTGVIAPYFRVQGAFSERYLQLNANELSWNVLDNPGFRFGPVVSYHPGRDDDVDDAVVRQMRPIDDTFEAGLFAEFAWREGRNPRHRAALGVTLLTDAGGEANGIRARVSARYWRPVATAVDVHIGGGFIYADSDYTRHYFGVTPQNVGTSGLPFYNAGSGMNEYFLTLGGVAYLTRNWLAAAGVRLSQLAGDAKDSPIVSQRGDKSQFIGGVGVGYMWR